MIFINKNDLYTIIWFQVSLSNIYLLYIDLRPGQICHSKDGGSAYSIGVGELGWQYGTGLKSHGTVTNWCTRREWPVNCMTVISAQRRSNMPFQRRQKCIFRWPVMERDWVGFELLYNSVHRKFNQFLEIRELEKWCCRENSTQQRAGPPGLRLSSPGKQERNTDGHKSGGQYVAVLFGLQLPLTHNPFNKVRGIFF